MRTIEELNKTGVIFKSVRENYGKEENGTKPNTLRVVNMREEKFKILAAMALFGVYGTISIREVKEIGKEFVETGRHFTRKIKDVTFWVEECIISWEHSIR